MRRSAVVLVAACALLALLAASASAKVLRVGAYHGIEGQYKTIQAAVNAAKPGDWVLIAPGDYKTTSYGKVTDPDGGKAPAAVVVKRADIFIRGMNRNTVIVDGTKSGPACNSVAKDQNYGPDHEGLNGIEVFEADNDWVQNLTTCNFLSGPNGDTGNEIWWNGGAGGGHIHGIGFVASYLNATSTFYKSESTASTYGLFSSDWSGGVFEDDYASNFNDAGYYIGGCAQKCDQQILHSQSEYNALGYSGTNSGGSMLFAYNKFDNNKDGFDTNSQNNSDWPSPQDGACLKGVKPAVKGADSCWILYKNEFYDNNDPNVPEAGSAAQGPVGTGVSIEGMNDTIMDNTFKDNGAWGVVLEPYPDGGTAPSLPTKAGMACHGGTPDYNLLGLETVNCLYESAGDAVLNNTFTHDGYFGNDSNGDFEQSTEQDGYAANCFAGNTDTSGALYTAAGSQAQTAQYLQSTYGTCGGTTAADPNDNFLLEAGCDTEALGTQGTTVLGCTATDKYPRATKVVMHKLPTKQLKTMKNPCAGVPKNPWCAKK